jgi:hypothetical protein
LVFDHDLLVGIVEVDGELGWEDGLWGRSSATVGTNRINRQTGLCPFRDYGDLAVYNVRHVRVVEGDAVAVTRRGQVGVQVAQVIGGLRLVSMLTVVYGTLVCVL